MPKQSNYGIGRAAEYRTLYKIKDKIDGGRFLLSKGPTDLWWIDSKNQRHEAQVKASSKKGVNPYITKKEMVSLNEYAEKMKGKMIIWLVKRPCRKPEEWTKLN